MRTDKDRPSTWKSYKQGMCNGCHGHCCTMPVEVKLADLIRLGVTDEDEAASGVKKLSKRLIKEKIIISYRSGTEFFMLASRPNGDCHFLHPITRLCTVYEKRPDTCREFPSIGPRPGFCPVGPK
ncbi:YkgJ family cysteine cluster protein [Bdellovibrio sp. HCB274]|uniref:YkgJ family cysteine cluster protein n=1 Tax=Bdellovibrio sp. HCB274 TaxID=3394361 RepID=UPI0039B38B16